MNIDAIRNGIVIDHIRAGKAMEIYKLLNLEALDCSVAIIKNAPSELMGKKDIIKIDRVLDVDLDALDRHIGYFMQGGMGLPDPAFYTRDDADTRVVMDRYRAYVRQILALTGTPEQRLDADVAAVIGVGASTCAGSAAAAVACTSRPVSWAPALISTTA